MINNVWLHVNVSGEVTMRASEDPRALYRDYVQIYPANVPPALEFYKDFFSGKTISRKKAENVKAQAFRHYRFEDGYAPRPWKIVDMQIEPDEHGTNVLRTTLESDGMRVSKNLWPPRTPSARLFLQAFQNGKPLYDKDLGLLIKFIRVEADMVGLNAHESRGILDWHPDWEEYL